MSKEVNDKQNSSVPVTLWIIVAVPLQSNDPGLIEFARDTLLKFVPVQDRWYSQELWKIIFRTKKCVFLQWETPYFYWMCVHWSENQYPFVFVTEYGITQSTKSGHLMSSGNKKSPNRGRFWKQRKIQF